MAAIAADRSTPYPRRTGDAAASSCAVRRRDCPGGWAGRWTGGGALPAMGAARRTRGSGARRERGGTDPDAAGAGRVVVGYDRSRRLRFALSLSRWRRRLPRPGLALPARRRAWRQRSYRSRRLSLVRYWLARAALGRDRYL